MLDLLELYEWMRESEVDRIELDAKARHGAMAVIGIRGDFDDEVVVDMATIRVSDVNSETLSEFALANVLAGLERRVLEQAKSARKG